MFEVPDWPWSYIALSTAAGAMIIALGAWIYAIVAIRRERLRRHVHVQESVWQWASQAASKEEVSRLRETVETMDPRSQDFADFREALASLDARITELDASRIDVERVDALRNAVSVLSDRVLTLEAEQRSRAEEHGTMRFPRLRRR